MTNIHSLAWQLVVTLAEYLSVTDPCPVLHLMLVVLFKSLCSKDLFLPVVNSSFAEWVSLLKQLLLCIAKDDMSKGETSAS